MVFVGTEAGTILGLNAATGAVIWSVGSPNTIFSSPAVANGVVYIGDTSGSIVALNEPTGTTVWTKVIADPNAGGEVLASPSVANGVIYIGTNLGTFFRAQCRQWLDHLADQRGLRNLREFPGGREWSGVRGRSGLQLVRYGRPDRPLIEDTYNRRAARLFISCGGKREGVCRLL